MKRTIIVGGAVLMILTLAQIGLACSCELPDMDLSEKQLVRIATKNADAVFVGEVVDVIDNQLSLTIKFSVKKSWKGVKKLPEVIVYTGKGSGDCGFPFKMGLDYLVYATKSSNGDFTTKLCSRTNDLSASKTDLSVLNRKKRHLRLWGS